MCINRTQRGNGKPHLHKLNPVSEHNASTRDNFGALKAATSITDQGKDKKLTNERPVLDKKTRDTKSK